MKIRNFSKGLNTDVSPQFQPESTYRFAMNAVLESLEGDISVLSSENSNEEFYNIPDNYILLGSIYIENNETLLFLVSYNEQYSEIGVAYKDGSYKTLVNTDQLNFKVTKQINAVFRVRRSCGRVVYFTDFYNKPRLINIDNLEKHKKDGNWDKDKFLLIRDYKKAAKFENISIVQDGNIDPGSYNFGIQYLDEDLNPTDFFEISDVIIVYNDFESKNFSEIRGSTSIDTFYNKRFETSKSIKLKLSNIDDTFPYYRIAIIKSVAGSGYVNKVLYSNNISTKQNTYVYSNDLNKTVGTEEEVLAFQNKIHKVKALTQIEDRLNLLNVKEREIDYTIFQRYASRIKADLVLKEIVLNDINQINNPKRGTLYNEDIGYTPGEIYPFNIHYVFDNYEITPGFHIPGRNPSYYSQMSTDNKLENTFYREESCNKEFWCQDSQGDELKDNNVRHHRFPLRSEINEPLYYKETVSNNTYEYNSLYVIVTGDIDSNYADDYINYTVTYEINGVQYNKQFTITVANYDSNVGITQLVDSSTETITYIGTVENGNPSGLVYTPNITTSVSEVNEEIYKTKIFGIKFSDIEIPTDEELNGHKIIGYFITRGKLSDSNKTIIDSGVLTPLIVNNDKKFIAHGHLVPNTTNLKKDIFAFINPNFKFLKKEDYNITKIIQEGRYSVEDVKLASKIIEDVQPGTSYDSSIHKRREKDNDGFSLHILTRNNKVTYNNEKGVLAEGEEINNVYYLDTLFSKNIVDINNENWEVYNLSTDNRIALIQLNKEIDINRYNIPYIVIKRDLSDPYSNYLNMRYYMETNSFKLYDSNIENSVTIFNGDSIISPMRYTSTVYYDTRNKLRETKSGLIFYIIGIVAALIGGLVFLSIAFAAFAVGLKRDKLAQVYGDLYEKGLQNTVDDNDTEEEFDPEKMEDDEIQWFMEVINSFWFESRNNIFWRNGVSELTTDFLNAPKTDYSESELLNYAVEKLTKLDTKADGGRSYQGFSQPEVYEINKDYYRRNQQKIYYSLPESYNYCDNCKNEFPLRVYYSQKSFSEELTDNYKVFLANNYKDIDGETGEITTAFTIQGNLFIVTQSAIYHLPANIQERITGDVVSFIGTGEFFSLPLKKIVDSDNGLSAGTKYGNNVLKTKYGVFIVSENQRVIYQFDGNSLKPISDVGESNWFKNNLPFELQKDYYNTNHRDYPFLDNTSNEFGIGYTSVYDNRNNRYIVTKKDYIFDDIGSKDYEFCIKDGVMQIFKDYQQTIDNLKDTGWNYLGIQDCKMKFERDTKILKNVEVYNEIPNDTDIHVFYDISGSFGGQSSNCSLQIQYAVNTWYSDFQANHPEWQGNLYEYYDNSERWVKFSEIVENKYISQGEDINFKNVVVISFINEAEPYYHDIPLNNTLCPLYEYNGTEIGGNCPTDIYIQDYNDHILRYTQFKSFKGILYPIVFNESSLNCTNYVGTAWELLVESTKSFLEHSIAAITGENLTLQYMLQELQPKNPAFTNEEWDNLLIALEDNPYPYGLSNFGWKGKWKIYAPPTGEIINQEQLTNDLNELLEGEIVNSYVEKEFCSTEFMEIEPQQFQPLIYNNSWTKSFNLKHNVWVSYHNYLPNLYFFTPTTFYSWFIGNKIYKHNIKHKFLKFYDNIYDFVISFVSNISPTVTKIYEYFNYNSKALEYSEETKTYREIDSTFNKAIFSNSSQSSGELNITPKSTDENYILQQIQNNTNNIIVDKHEETYSINGFRDYVIDYSKPLFIKNIKELQDIYYIDKKINDSIIDYNKNWQEIELFRDKYLEIRFFYHTFENVKFNFNYIEEDEKISIS